MEMSLTILICVHSTETLYDDLLIRALNSLEKQTYKNFKTLIVLDECWQHTEEEILLRNYNLDIKIVKKENKNGLANAKNLGLSMVETDYVGFLDGDDLYEPTKLEKQVNFLKNTDVDFLATQCWLIYGIEKDQELFDSWYALGTNETHNEIKEQIFVQNVIPHGSVIVKMESLRKLNYYRDVRGKEDWDLWQRAITEGYIFHNIQERLYIHRIGTGQAR
jgi:glycosyltransferase involved in cell wall biosynthesis